MASKAVWIVEWLGSDGVWEPDAHDDVWETEAEAVDQVKLYEKATGPGKYRVAKYVREGE